MTAGLALDELRARRAELQLLDDAVSYTRRVAQGRADLVRAELAGRGLAENRPELVDELRDVLSDRLLGESGRPPRPVDDHSEHPLALELETLCAERGFGRFRELDDAALAELAAALDDFERRVSGRRQEVFVELDTLTEELVRRLEEQR